LEQRVFNQKLTPEQEREAAEQTALAIENRRTQMEGLEEQAARFVGAEQYLADEITKIGTHRRYVTGEQLHRFLSDFILHACPNTRLSYDSAANRGELRADTELVRCVVDFCHATETPVPILPTGHAVSLTFDAATAFRSPRLQFITVLHPLIGAARKYFAGVATMNNAHHVVLRTDKLAPGLYFYFVFRLDINGSRRRSTLETLLFRDDLSEACSPDVAEQLLGEMAELGEAATGAGWEVEPALVTNVSNAATQTFLDRKNSIRHEVERTNTAFVEMRLASIWATYERSISRQKSLLDRGEREGKDERYLRLRRGTLARLEAELAAKVREIEQQRNVSDEYEEVCAGILEVAAR
jgi:hypothetical protein